VGGCSTPGGSFTASANAGQASARNAKGSRSRKTATRSGIDRKVTPTVHWSRWERPLPDFALQALGGLDTADTYELFVERHRAAASVVTSNRETIE
jgi:hypothetical protein